MNKYVDVVYDIEIMGNFFCLNTRHEDNTTHVFRLNDKDKFLEMYNRDGIRLWGENNAEFDDLLLVAWMDGYGVSELLRLANLIIHTEPFQKSRAISNYWELKNMSRFSFITGDLFQLTNKRNGLKFKGIILAHPKLKELPFAPGSRLTEDEKLLMIEYCHNDTAITMRDLEVIKKGSVGEVTTRANIDAREMFYDNGIDDAWKISAPKLVEKNFILSYDRDCGIDLSRRKKENHTKGTTRSEIPISDVLPYMTFNDSGIQNIYDIFIKKQVKFSKSPKGRWTPSDILQMFTADDGQAYTVGLGGLHSTKDRMYIDSVPDDKVLILSDVAAYYPNMMRVGQINAGHIKNNYMFDFICNGINLRDTFKKLISTDSTAKAKSDGYKLNNNTMYGLFGDPTSTMYDFKSTLTTTLPGQFKLLKLIDMYQTCSDAVVVNANTDGVAILVSKQYEELILQCNRNWEAAYDLVLEEEYYDKWYQKSCNCYTARQTTGKIKAINEFATTYDLEKGMSVAKIIPKAMREFWFNGIPVEETIRNSNYLQDFITASKKNRTYDVLFDGEKVANINRYYKSMVGMTLTSYNKDNGKTAQIPNADNVQLCTDIDDFYVIPDDLDYDYYINATWRAINTVKYGYDNPGAEISNALVDEVYKSKPNLESFIASHKELSLKAVFTGVTGIKAATLDNPDAWMDDWDKASSIMINLDADPRLHVLKIDISVDGYDEEFSRGLQVKNLASNTISKLIYSDHYKDTCKLQKLGKSWYEEHGYDIQSSGWVTIWGVSGSSKVDYHVLTTKDPILDGPVFESLDFDGWKTKASPTHYLSTTPSLYRANEISELQFSNGTDIINYIDSLGFATCEKEDAPMYNLWKCIDTKGSSSLVSNAESVSGLIFDVDGESSMASFMREFDKFKYGMFTSGSHTPKKHKFRFILPFQKAISKHEYLGYKASIQERMTDRIDLSTLAINRRFYVPTLNDHSMKHVKTKGKYFKLSDMFEFAEPTEYVESVKVQHEHLGDMWYDVILPDAINSFDLNFNENNRHHAIIVLTKILGDAGYTNEEVFDEMSKVEKFTHRTKYSDADIMSRINDILKRY